ncbi:TetR family transcriptional regulator [Streptomyces capparidis]
MGPGTPGLRARKKERTRQAISDTAIGLFLERGFDAVSVAEVAAAAEVSKPTLFRYFAGKEDLALQRIADHRGEAARVVRERRPGESPVAALHRHFRAGLDARDPVTGLNDSPDVLAFHRMLLETPALLARLASYTARDEEALAGALAEAVPGGDTLAPRLAAAQLVAANRLLAQDNWRELVAGRTADEVHPRAVAAADRAFHLLAGGLGEVYGRPG